MVTSLKLPKISQKMTTMNVKLKFCESEKIFVSSYAERKLATLFVLINMEYLLIFKS